MTQLPGVDEDWSDESAAQLKRVAVQELACLVLFVSQLFNLGDSTLPRI